MIQPINLLTIVGARPNFMKAAALDFAFSKEPQFFKHRLVHTGQHHDAAMSGDFFKDLCLPEPAFHLGVSSALHGEQTGKMLEKLEQVFLSQKPELVIVVGDVNSSLAGALAAAKLHIPVAHVEAGLRSFNKAMPEEINRKLIDDLSSYLFASEPAALENLKREAFDGASVHLVGNVMIDTLYRFLALAKERKRSQSLGLMAKNYYLLTFHRPENVDSAPQLHKLVQLLLDLNFPAIFPLHPRTKKRLEEQNLLHLLQNATHIKLTEPQNYLDFLSLMHDSCALITDSGGIQEECSALHVPCFTLRKETERPITLTHGSNTLCSDPDLLFSALKAPPKISKPIEFWDAYASKRIAQILLKELRPQVQSQNSTSSL